MTVVGLGVDLADEWLGRAVRIDRVAVAGQVEPVVVHFAQGGIEPGLVAEERPTETGFVAVDHGIRPVHLKPVLGAPRRVLADVEEVAVELVRSGLDRRVQHAADPSAVLGAEAGGLHPVFGDHGRRKVEAELAAATIVGDVDAVDEDDVLLGDTAVDPGSLIELLFVRHDAGHQLHVRPVVPRGLGYVLELLCAERGDGAGVVLRDQRRLGGDGDLLGGGAENEVDVLALPQFEDDRPLDRAQALEVGGDGVARPPGEVRSGSRRWRP